MFRRAAFAILVLSATLEAQQALDTSQLALLEEARQSALSYSKSLPDFVCTQIVRRSEDRYGSNYLRPIDTLTVNLTYFGHKEEYQLTEVNGRATRLDYQAVGGAVSIGEFGSLLNGIFAASSKTEFTGKGWARIRKRRAAVFGYRVAQENSNYVVRDATAPGGPTSAISAYHGEVSVDPETRAVLRVTLSAEPPANFPITESTCWTEYEYRDVVGKRYLVPADSRAFLARNAWRAVNEIEFRDYRKFQASASIIYNGKATKDP
jgi:hypothetical protein